MKAKLFSFVFIFSIALFFVFFASTVFVETTALASMLPTSIFQYSETLGSSMFSLTNLTVAITLAFIFTITWTLKRSSGIRQAFKTLIDDLTVIAKYTLALFTPAMTANRQLE